MNTPLNILEFGLIKPRLLHAHEVLNSIFNEIEIYENMGFKRFWMSEHYSREFAWYSPEMLMPLLAGYSSKIKIGWTGVLLHFHNPLLVASNFRLLSAIFDGRIDLGIAKAGGSKKASYHLLDNKGWDWEKRVKTLISLVRCTKEEELMTHEMHVPPHGTEAPELWSLGGSQRAALEAIENKTNFALTFMHPGSNYSKNIDTIKRYKEAYYEAHGEIPTTTALVCAVHTEERRIQKVLENRYAVDGFKNLFGSKAYIQDELIRIQQELGNDEFVLFNPICDRQKKIDSYGQIMDGWHDIVPIPDLKSAALAAAAS